MASSSRFLRPVSSVARSGVASRTFIARPFSTTTPNRVVKNITSTEEFRKIVDNSPKPVLIDCFATWCGPCKAISPILSKLSDQPGLSDKIEFVKIDVDELPEVSAELGIRAMPTFIVMKDGKKLDELIGANPQALTQMAQKAAA
ncbi:thioredoxin-like protein [Ilyonectria sp. MPI-CAGE-AT-0026]|nr:thioredoxin-like protein [Ilyonectria sp. MPI-CAGE-AT-0026]